MSHIYSCLTFILRLAWKVNFKIKNHTYHKIQALIIVGEIMTRPEIVGTLDNSSTVISNLVDKEWLCRYLRPGKIIYDNEGEFAGFEFQELCSSYGIKFQQTIVKNPRRKSIAEIMHLKMEDTLRTMEFVGTDWFSELDRALRAVVWAIHSTVSAASGYSPGQLSLSRDMVIPKK